MKPLFIFFICCISSLLLKAQTTIAPIPNWNQQITNNKYLFTPKSSNANFTYEIMPLEHINNISLDEWLKNTAEENIKSMGYSLPTGKDVAMQDVMSYKTYSALVSDASGKKWMISYMAYKVSSNNVRCVKMIMLPVTQNSYMNVALKHFINLSKQEKYNESNEETDSYTAKQSSLQDNKTTIETNFTGKQSLKPEEIKGVIINMQYVYGVGGMILPTYKPYLLLKDGSIYKNITVSPYDLNVAASKQAEPNNWGSWKIEGKTVVVQFMEKGTLKTSRWDKNWYWAKPAASNEKIQGAFKTISGGGNTMQGGTSMIVVGSNIAFNNKGQFSLEKYSGGSSYDFGVGTSTSSKQNTMGSYTLNGYSIELHFNNNKVLKKLFYFYPDSKATFGIGADIYTPIKN